MSYTPYTTRAGRKNKVAFGDVVLMKRRSLKKFVLDYMDGHRVKRTDPLDLNRVNELQGFLVALVNKEPIEGAVIGFGMEDEERAGVRYPYVRFSLPNGHEYAMYWDERDLKSVTAFNDEEE